MDYKKYNDNELIYMVRENDEESNNILLEKYKPIIINLSKKYYDVFNNNGYEFDDFYQEALISFYNAVKRYDSTKEVLFYSFVSLCINRSLASFSRKIYISIGKTYNSNNLDINDYEYCIEDERENPHNKYVYKGLENVIKKVIYSLPMESSSILELKLNGFTYKEIGILLDIPTSSVEFKSRKARSILRNKVKNYYCK